MCALTRGVHGGLGQPRGRASWGAWHRPLGTLRHGLAFGEPEVTRDCQLYGSRLNGKYLGEIIQKLMFA